MGAHDPVCSMHKELCGRSCLVVCMYACVYVYVCVRVTKKHQFTHLLVKYLCEKGAYCSLIHFIYVTRLRCLQDVQRVLLYQSYGQHAISCYFIYTMPPHGSCRSCSFGRMLVAILLLLLLLFELHSTANQYKRQSKA